MTAVITDGGSNFIKAFRIFGSSLQTGTEEEEEGSENKEVSDEYPQESIKNSFGIADIETDATARSFPMCCGRSQFDCFY